MVWQCELLVSPTTSTAYSCPCTLWLLLVNRSMMIWKLLLVAKCRIAVRAILIRSAARVSSFFAMTNVCKTHARSRANPLLTWITRRQTMITSTIARKRYRKRSEVEPTTTWRLPRCWNRCSAIYLTSRSVCKIISMQSAFTPRLVWHWISLRFRSGRWSQPISRNGVKRSQLIATRTVLQTCLPPLLLLLETMSR